MGYLSDLRKKIGHDLVIVVGAGVFVYKDGKVLLQKRKDNHRWSNHGGSVEIGETTEETAKRELFEETGLTANRLEFLGVFSGKDRMYTYPNGDMIYSIGIDYICRDFSGSPHDENDEVSELKWFDIDNLPEEISEPQAKAFEAFVEWAKNNGE